MEIEEESGFGGTEFEEGSAPSVDELRSEGVEGIGLAEVSDKVDCCGD